MRHNSETRPSPIVVIERTADRRWRVVSDLAIGTRCIRIDRDADYAVGSTTAVWLSAAQRESPATVTHALQGDTERRVLELELDPRDVMRPLERAFSALEGWIVQDDEGLPRLEFLEESVASRPAQLFDDVLAEHGWEAGPQLDIISSEIWRMKRDPDQD